MSDTLALANAALDAPLSPELASRCPRCGQRFPADDATECARCAVTFRSKQAAAYIVPRQGMIREYLRGIAYVPRGALLIVRSPKLWPFAIVPLLLNILALFLAAYAVEHYAQPWVDGVITRWDEAGGMWSAMSYGLAGLTRVVFALVYVATAFLIVLPPFNLIYKFLFMPVMELLTEATERTVVGFKEPGGFEVMAFLRNVGVGVLNAVIMTSLQLVLLLVLLPLNFVPLVGSAVWLVVPPAIFASLDYTDMNLVRRGYTTREKLRLWWYHQWRFFGFGVAFFFFITIPVLNALVIPAAAAGGALLYLELDRK